MKKVLFAVSSLGLGHATRSLPIINKLKKDHKLTIISYGNTLKFLKKELSEEKGIDFISMKDYPKFGRGNWFTVNFNMIVDTIKFNYIVKKEKEFVEQVEDDYDLIFSDGRYGFNSKKIPSFLLSHQISLVLPSLLSLFLPIVEVLNSLYMKNFDKLFVADFKGEDDSLAGKLSHSRTLKSINHEFIGILSSYEKEEVECDIDYLFVISGYLKEKRDSFISKLVEEAKELEGEKVFILGDMSSTEVKRIEEHNITIYPSATGKFKNRLFNRAKTIVSRSGYTTIMDLVELDKDAILFPTPNQGEQEYLAESEKINRHFVTENNQENFKLSDLAEGVAMTEKFIGSMKTVDSLKKIEKSFNKYGRENFFSIIIPAHNEEKFIDETLLNISRLNYSTDRFEVILVENGSTDTTFEIAKEWKEVLPNLSVYKSEKGVSKAKNLGKNLVSSKSNWTIFLDADTILENSFLKDLNFYLNKEKNKNLSIGTCSISPSDDNSILAKLWYKVYDISHEITNTSYSIQIAKTALAEDIDFDEELNYSEDLKYIRDLEKFGDFFFFKTKEVATSTRRFKNYGYLTLACLWTYQAIMPKKLKKNRKYRVVRDI